MTSQCPYDNLLILDFETTSHATNCDYPFEIIQFSVAVVDPQTKTIREGVSFNEYVRPVINPVLTQHCADFTGIKQETLDSAETFLPIYRKFLAWLEKNNFQETKFAIVSDSRQDMWRIAQYQFCLVRETLPSMFRSYINIWKTFETIPQVNRNMFDRGPYIQKMSTYFHLETTGRAHDAFNDCIQLAKITVKILETGVKVIMNEALVCRAPWRQKTLEAHIMDGWRTDFQKATKIYERVMPLVVANYRPSEYVRSIYTCVYCKKGPSSCGVLHAQPPTALYRNTGEQIVYAKAAGYY